MIKSLAHVCIYSRDLSQTESFYVDGLGLKVRFRFIRKGELFGFYLGVSESQFIEVFLREESSSGIPSIGHLCLETDDIAALHRHLASRKIGVTEPKMGADHSWQIWLEDPDGTRIEIHQYTAKSSQRTGADCIVDW